jgi:hypothetical protein
VTVPAFWLQIDNFGDKLTPWLVWKVTGEAARFADISEPGKKLMAAGSILSYARQGCVVWGSGALSLRESIANNADFRAVRGPASRKLILEQGGQCPEIYGDPGLLLPCWIPRGPTQYKLAIVPHFVDYERALDLWGHRRDVVIVNLRGGVEPVTKTIIRCEAVASSSLHGLVVAMAYGIPHVRLVLSDKIAGDGLKYEDFYAGLGGWRPSVVDCQRGSISIEQVLDAAREPEPRVPDYNALWDACPIKELTST